jgi:hypothetical protein
MHAHSDWSYDGKWTLDELAIAFAARNYNVLLMTEHDQGFTEDRRREYWDACRAASTEKILIVPGMEYSDPTNTVHMLVWGDIPFLGTGIETQRMLERASNLGAISVFAHPSRRNAWKAFRRDWLGHIHGIEQWNRKTDGWSPSLEAGRLIEETGVSPAVGLDFHSPKQFFPLALHLDIEGEANENSVMEALRTGNFSCKAFGAKADIFNGGIIGSGARCLEACRRIAARSYHRISGH